MNPERIYKVMYQVIQTQTEFAQDVAYERRIPPTLEQGCAELLACVELLTEERLDEQARRHVASVAAARAAAVTEMLSRITTSQEAPQERLLNTEPVNLMELAHRARDLLWQKAYRRGVTLHLEGPANLPTVVGDPVWLLEALRQVLENIIESSREGGPVHMRLCAMGDQVCVEITNRGDGIATNQPQGLLSHCCHVDSPAPCRLSGSEMRLYIGRVVTEAHGGRVWATSEGPGKGSAVTLALPRNWRNAVSAFSIKEDSGEGH